MFLMALRSNRHFFYFSVSTLSFFARHSPPPPLPSSASSVSIVCAMPPSFIVRLLLLFASIAVHYVENFRWRRTAWILIFDWISLSVRRLSVPRRTPQPHTYTQTMPKKIKLGWKKEQKSIGDWNREFEMCICVYVCHITGYCCCCCAQYFRRAFILQYSNRFRITDWTSTFYTVTVWWLWCVRRTEMLNCFAYIWWATEKKRERDRIS